jgi:predicted ATP-grasp superfamily ATP-dependent carboligase
MLPLAVKTEIKGYDIVGETLESVRDITSQIAIDDKLRHRNAELMTHRVTYDALVLDARLRQSLAAVRSLGSRGLRVAVLGTARGSPTFSSRWCQQAFICPAQEGTDAYFSYLEELLDRIRVSVLITASDNTLALLRRHREQLEARVRIALAKEPALGIAINKARTLEVARQLGLRVPRSISVQTVSQVKAALDEIGLPVVVKPVESWASNEREGARLSCRLVTTLDEAQVAVEELTRFGGTVLFQQFLSGRRESVSLLYANGQIYARYAQRHTRIVGGESAIRKSIAVPPDIGDAAEHLVREIDLEGIAEVEFRRDSAENPYLMEINPRLWASTELAVRSGVDFPYLLYQWASGQQIDLVKSYPVGGQMRYLKGDILNTAAALIPSRQKGRPEVEVPPARAILDFCLSFLTPMRYDCVDWKDPLPVCRATVGFVRDVLQWGGKSLRRKAS